ncbi:MAG: hypothetical protein AMS25_00805 [Gemmatimonas sp. SM23_52]|nr:MAG: hypothetical protein AMS25_00805 [Gemmatimonas sp. SM23_52]
MFSHHPGPYLLLSNPRARSVDRTAIAGIAARLGLEGRAIREIGRDGSARALAAEAVRARRPYLLVAGGDGTLHEVVQEVAGTDTALGLIPLGTANDLARRLTIPLELDATCALLSAPRVAAVDLLRIGERLIASVGGFGIAADIVAFSNRVRRRPPLRQLLAPLGSAIYPAAAAATIIARRPRDVRYALRADVSRPHILRAAAILVGLTDRFGGALKLVPGGGVQPGTFCALVITASTRRSLLAALQSLRSGHTAGRYFRSYSGLTCLEFHSSHPVGAFADGEWLGLRHRSRVELERAALKVIVPPAFAGVHTRTAVLQEAI